MLLFNFHLLLGLICALTNISRVFGHDIYEKISSSVQDSELVDPNSLYYSHHTQSVVNPENFKNLQYLHKNNEVAINKHDKKYDEDHSYCKDSPYEVFSRRLINILISKSNLKINDGLATGKLNLEATEEQLIVLKEFGNGKVSIRQVDKIISSVIQPIPIDLMEEVLNFADRLSIYAYQHRVIFGAFLLVFFVIIIALKVKWTRWRILILIFDVFLIISFILTWLELLQESEIKLMAKQTMYSKMPDECKLNENSLSKSLLLFFGFGKGDCVKYFEAVMTDPVLQVTPLTAFSHMCSKFFLHPVSVVAHYLSDFIAINAEILPWPFNHVVKIIMVIFMPFLLCGLLFILFGGAMGMKIGPFFHIYLHGRQALLPENSLAYEDRQAIQVIRSEIRETLPAPETITSNQKILTDSKNSPKKTKKDTPSEDLISQKPAKVVDSDINSDEFPEEKEYEKISKKKVEDEINQIDELKIKSNTVANQENDKNQTNVTKKKVLEKDL